MFGEVGATYTDVLVSAVLTSSLVYMGHVHHSSLCLDIHLQDQLSAQTSVSRISCMIGGQSHACSFFTVSDSTTTLASEKEQISFQPCELALNLSNHPLLIILKNSK